MSLTLGLTLARSAGTLARLSGRGATSLPGRVLLRVEPDGISALASRLSEGSVVLSATNGKTTTAAMAASILERGSRRLVHNRAGANMGGGIASTLLGAARRNGRIDGSLGLFEVDEFWLERMVAALHPRALLLANLFRDQLDRFGELDIIADRWADLVQRGAGRDAALVLNADDPLVADLGREREALYFGIEDTSLALPAMAHAADSKHCRRCGAPYAYSAILLGHLGHYECPRCGRTRPRPAVHAGEVTLHGVRRASFTLTTPAGRARVRLPLPGLYNVYNAVAAAALAHTLGAPLSDTVAGLEATRPAFGRAESLNVRGAEVHILLVKNPAGADEVLRTLALEAGEHHILAVLNDQIADGRDVSWVWDADFEMLAGRIGRVTASGTRAAEMALRLKYAGVPEDRIVVEGDLERSLAGAVASARADGTPLYALPTYTAMLALRELLVARGEALSSWA